MRRGRLVAQEVRVPCLEVAAQAIAQLHQRRRGRLAGYMALAAAAVVDLVVEVVEVGNAWYLRMS